MNFKEGDEIIMLGDCCGNKKGKKYTLKMDGGDLYAYAGNFGESCSCEHKWKLVKKAPESIKVWAVVSDGKMVPYNNISRIDMYPIYKTKKEARFHRFDGDKVVKVEIKIVE